MLLSNMFLLNTKKAAELQRDTSGRAAATVMKLLLWDLGFVGVGNRKAVAVRTYSK